MKRRCFALVSLAGIASAAIFTMQGSAAQPEAVASSAPPAFDGTLSVLTYNVHGLPWPLASGRPAAFAQIAERLAAMRAQGNEPQVVVLQEAFTATAAKIGRAAGYRYVAYGPAADDPGAGGAFPAAAFAAAARWSRGETEGPLLDSGLVILSDYPIIGRASIAYPRDACAGYDCLANKGALLVRLALPGRPEPIDVVTTHLNCRGRTGVAVDRADAAYGRELANLATFIGRAHDPRLGLIVAGDFNVGHAPSRQSMIDAETDVLGATPALATLIATGRPVPPDAVFSWAKDKDLQLAVPSPSAPLTAVGVTVPFGHQADGSMLSDHVGYAVRYRLEPGAPRLAQSATAA